MDDVGVHTIFEKDSCKMVQVVIVLRRVVQIAKIYKISGRIDTN